MPIIEEVLTLALIFCLKGEWELKLRNFINSTYQGGKKAVSQALSDMSQYWDTLNEDQLTAVAKVMDIFANSCSSIEPSKIIRITLPPELLKHREPGTFKALHCFLTQHRQCTSDISALIDQISDILIQYNKAHHLPQLADYRPGQEHIDNRAYTKQDTAVNMVVLFAQQFIGTLLTLSQSQRFEDKILYYQVRESFTFFMKETSQNKELGQPEALKLINKSLDGLLHKIDDQAVWKTKEGSYMALQDRVSEWQRLLYSILSRMTDDNAWKFPGQFTELGLAEGKMGPFANVWFSGISMFNKQRFVGTSWNEYPLNEQGFMRSLLHHFKFDVHGEPMTLVKFFKKKFIFQSKQITPPKFLDDSITEKVPEMQKASIATCESVMLLKSLVMEFELRHQQLGDDFFVSGEHRQWLAIIKSSVQASLELHAQLFLTDYVKEIGDWLRTQHAKAEETEVALMPGGGAKLINTPSVAVNVTDDNPFKSLVEKINFEPVQNSRLFHERFALASVISDFGNWFHQFDKNINDYISKKGIIIQNDLDILSVSDIDLAILWRNQPHLFAKINQQDLKCSLRDAKKRLDGIDDLVNEFNKAPFKLSSEHHKTFNEIVSHPGYRFLKVKNNELFIHLTDIASYDDLKNFFDLIQKIQAIEKNFSLEAICLFEKGFDIALDRNMREKKLPPAKTVQTNDVKAKVQWFIRVYTALYDGQTGAKWIRKNWSLDGLHSDEAYQRKLHEIEQYAGKRSKTALNIVNTFFMGQALDMKNKADIYKEIRATCLKRGSAFSRSPRKAVFAMNTCGIDNIRELARSDTSSRTYKICRALGAEWLPEEQLATVRVV